MKKLFAAVAVAATLIPSIASAVGSYTGRVIWIHAMNDGWVLVHTSSTISGQVCSHATRFVLNATTPAGKNQLNVILAAYAMGTDVHIAGDATCPAHSGEQIYYVTTAP